MKPCFLFLSPLFFLLASTAAPGMAQEESNSEETAAWTDQPVVVRLGDDDLADARRVRELERLIDRAEEEKVAAVILRLNLSRDLSLETVQRVLDTIAESEVEIIALVDPIATGPGALVALASDAIYLTPAGIIGAAGVEAPSEDAEEDEEEASSRRSNSILEARARSLAALNGHRIEVVRAMIDEAREIRIGDEVLSEEGSVLTLTAEEATRDWDGEPVLARGVVETVEELLEAEGIKGVPVSTNPRAFGESLSRERLSKARGEGAEEADEGELPTSAEAEAESEALFGRRDEESYRDKVIVLEVGQDTLATGKASFEFMERTLRKAELDGAAAVVFDMDTPGGFAWYTDGLVLNSLQNVSYPTYAFVNSRAESAGAIIALGTDEIYMRPAATIGSALVVSGTGQDLGEDMSDKATQMIISSVRNVAELNGHNPDVAEAFVTRDKEVKIDGLVIHEAGNVLNLNTIDATEIIGGRPVLAEGVAESIDDILEQEGIEAEVINATPLGMEAFAHWVQKLSILFIVLGLAGAYMELNSPGFGIPGLVSVLAFSIFFFGNYMAGNLAGYELAVLLVLGLILIGVEIFLFPGAILPGAIGGTLVLVSLGLAMVDRVDLEWKWEGLPGAESWFAIFRGSFLALAIGLVGAFALILFGMRFLPQTRLGSRFVLAEAVAGGASLSERPRPASSGAKVSGGPGDEPETAGGTESLEGEEGEATTDLVPSGKGRFGGRLMNVVSDGEFIARGARVVIAKHEGSRIVVRKV